LDRCWTERTRPAGGREGKKVFTISCTVVGGKGKKGKEGGKEEDGCDPKRVTKGKKMALAGKKRPIIL